MSGTTLSGTYFNPVTLSDGSTQNPATITGTISAAGTALLAEAGTNWTVANYGSVQGTGTAGTGIALVNDGTITNSGAGLIKGDGTGIYFESTGTVVNTGTVVGAGTGTGSSFGIVLTGSGAVTNLAGGFIYGFNRAIDAHGPVTVMNSGAITSGTTNATVLLRAGGAVTNAAGAVILGTGGAGVYVDGSAGDIFNGGVILGGTAVSDGIRLEKGGYISNASSGTIDSGKYSGIFVTGSIGTILNAGLIESSTTGGNGINIISGGIVSNAATGTITAIQFSGLYIGGTAGTVDNAGLIAATGSGPKVVGLFLGKGGSVTNEVNGTLIGNSGIGFNGASATLINYGTILSDTAHSAAFFDQGGRLTNAASGTIDSTGGPGVYVTGAAAAVVNAGMIVSGTVNGSAVVLKSGGYVNNKFGGTINGVRFNGIYAEATTVSVTNAGVIESTGTGAAGIALLLGGYVSNAATGTISASNFAGSNFAGLLIGGGTGTVVNAGSISGTGTTGTFGDGVYLSIGGSVTNQTGGMISGGNDGVRIGTQASATGTGTVFNHGSIAASHFGGIVLHSYGLVINAATGSISGNYGVGLLAGGTLTNAGRIAGLGTFNDGVQVDTGGSVTNQSGGAIIGSADGVRFFGGGGTVDNVGSIAGMGGTAVSLATGFTNLVVFDPRATFSGTVDGGNAIGTATISTLELATGTSSGTLSGLGTQFINFGSIALDAGADWFVAGNSSGLAGTISGFTVGDTIEVTGIAATGSLYSPETLNSPGTLTLIEASGSVTLKLMDLPGTFTTSDFVVTNVTGGAEVTVACFAAGTRISTEHGEVQVELLHEGDKVQAVLDGRTQPITWLGQRRVDCLRHPNPKQVWPICVSADAFGPRHPYRDLWLSPDHAVFVDDVLIPIKCLINGTTIRQVPMSEVTYYHLELKCHEVLLAEGLPCESFLDTGNRCNFVNAGGPVALHPGFASLNWEADACAPLIVTGSQLDTIRHWVNSLAAFGSTIGQQSGTHAA